jgi:hypothetical protein
MAGAPPEAERAKPKDGRKRPPRLPGAVRSMPPMPGAKPSAAPKPPESRRTIEVEMSWVELVDEAAPSPDRAEAGEAARAALVRRRESKSGTEAGPPPRPRTDASPAPRRPQIRPIRREDD